MDIKLKSAEFFAEGRKHIFTFEASSAQFGSFTFPVLVPNGRKGISHQWFSAHDHLVTALQLALEQATRLREQSRPAQEP